MFNRPEITAEWTVHAQVTITHPGQENPSGCENSAENGNVRVVYSWHGHSGDDSGSKTTTVANQSSDSYGFNRGGISFAASPPSKNHQMTDSGYTSEKPFSIQIAQGNKDKSFDKKCRSTCNITLESPFANTEQNVSCRRAFSLRSPHSTISEYPVAETIPRRARTFTTHFCTELPERRVEIKDAASQTTPIATEIDSEDEQKGVETNKRKNKLYGRRRHETDSAVTGSRNSRTAPRRLCRSPVSKILSPHDISNLSLQTPIKINGKLTDTSESKHMPKSSEGNSSSDSRKPRTVHIDVYCTGSEVDEEENIESNTSNSENDDSMSVSSPQTVFESEKVRVSHKKIQDLKELPRALMFRKAGVKPSASSGYPSMASSSSTIAKGLSVSTMSSLINSDSRIGCSSLGTSWKDTTSDMESLLNTDTNSRALSIDPSIDSFEYEDSLDRERIQALDKLLWLQSKTWKSPDAERKFMRSKFKDMDSDESNDEDDDETNSWIFSKNSDEGASSIINKETVLSKPTLTQMSSQVSSVDTDDKTNVGGDHLSYYNIHEDKFDFINTSSIANQDVLAKLIKCPNISFETKNYPEDASNIQSVASVDFKTTLPSLSKINSHNPSLNKEYTHKLTIENSGSIQIHETESIPEKESSRATSPFVNTLPGYFTGHLERARRFGNVIGTLRKPGHHVGPAKNPNCTCEHCKRWLTLGYGFSSASRGRAFSAGSVQNYRPIIRRDSKRNTSEEPDCSSLGWTDL